MVSQAPPPPPLTFDPRLMAPPMRSAASSEVSSLGDLHDDGASSVMTPQSHQNYQHSQQQYLQHQQYSSNMSFGYDDSIYGGDDVHDQDEHLVVRGEVPSSDLSNVNTLFVSIGAVVGVALAILVAQVDGARDDNSSFAKWLLLPGELYANAMFCIVLPAIFLNSVLGSMHFSTLNKNKALGSKMLVYFVATTLLASVLGALLALCFVPTFSESHALRIATTGSGGDSSAGILSVTFRCPQQNSSSSSNQSLLLQPDGSMRCAQPLEQVNGTLFRIEDIAHTFRIHSSSSSITSSSSIASAAAAAVAIVIPSLGDQVVVLLDTLFPMSLFESFLRGDVLSVVIIGAALGVALLHFSYISSVAGTSDSSLLFLLLMQSEVILSVLVRALLQGLPIGMVFMIYGAILRSPRDADVSEFTPSTQDLVSLAGVLLFALVLNLATMLALTMVTTKSNPLSYVRQLLPAQLVALGTSSSLLALPTTVRSIAATRQVSMPLAYFVCSTGTVLNKTGSAIYLSVASVYIVSVAGLQGHELTAGNIVVLILASVVCSFVLPPMPRGGFLVVGSILTSVFSIDNSGATVLIMFLAAMDWLCDPFVSALNATSSALVALILAHEMDERFRDQSFDTQEEETDDGMGGAMMNHNNGALQRPARPMLNHQESSINTSEVSI